MNRIREVLKLAADSMKNRTLHALLEGDTEYQKRTEEIRKAYEAFENLELTEEQRNIIDTLLVRKEEREYDGCVNAYMAGMLDAYEILKMFNLTEE